MPNLTEFLLARIAEDEERQVAELAPDLPPEVVTNTAMAAAVRLGHRLRAFGYLCAPRFIVARAALKYADHPDYREEWKP